LLSLHFLMNLHLYAILLLTTAAIRPISTTARVLSNTKKSAKERFIIQMVQCSRTLVEKEERDDVLLVV